MKRTCFCCNELAKHKLSMPCLPNITNKSIVQLSNQYPKGLGMGPFSTNYFKLCHGVICLVIVLGKVAFYISSSIEYGLARFAIIYISQFDNWWKLTWLLVVLAILVHIPHLFMPKLPYYHGKFKILVRMTEQKVPLYFIISLTLWL
jgi:hypothetical protein